MQKTEMAEEGTDDTLSTEGEADAVHSNVSIEEILA